MAHVESNMTIDGELNPITKTSELINDGENGTSTFVEVDTLSNYLTGVETLDNKQNNLDEDSTGTKYPTVNAVNDAIENVRQEISEVSGDKNFIYEQLLPSDNWIYTHNLGKKPSVVTTDSAGTVVTGQIIINDGNKVHIKFNFPFWGYAINN